MRYYNPDVSMPLEFMTHYFSLAETAIKLVGEKYRFEYAGDNYVITQRDDNFYLTKDNPINPIVTVVALPPQMEGK